MTDRAIQRSIAEGMVAEHGTGPVMMRVTFRDGRTSIADADCHFTPAGAVELYKRVDDQNKFVISYPSSEVRRIDYVVVPSVKHLAIKLITACSKTQPHGSRKLAELAGLEYDDKIIPILKKLRDAGKVRFADGKWTRS